jgi:hypothetical protein
LLDEFSSAGPYDFPNPYLFGAHGGPGRGEIHEVDGGDKEYEKSDSGKNVDISATAVGFDFAIKMGIKVDFFERLEMENVHGGYLVELVSEKILEISAYVFHGKIRKLVFQFDGRCVLLEKKIVVIKDIPPVSHHLFVPETCCKRNQEIEMEMGVLGDIFQDTGNLKIPVAIEDQDFVEGVFVPEIFFSHCFGENHRIGFGKCCIWISSEKREGENIEKIPVPEKNVFIKSFCFPGHQGILQYKKTGCVFHLWIVANHGRAQGSRCLCCVRGAAGKIDFISNPVDAIGLLMEFVITQFVSNVEDYEKETSHSHSQAKQIDEGVQFVSSHIPESYLEPILYHF